ncbi:tRNA uridine-5-carboxymethylaminomethyl(34) synthesis GTPase MnmE [Thiohalobacter sp. IOR34]|uniref:tRNA uridine-5-carboxymethylaminomethyl(34) synthesis GTPase MnmE n=1 Tax=Thiohalobacter sp. IOR34 TaxID=3057176 RepID=UPI0025B25F14|nr:tRNA uridine-5-carboxymethylaminomethyl(34) synthesis GTPase MnmE [Thiohalobacter sp. IOR34]WJW75503.1 tRNA uridine-5-carboxymethylaminomethyl(34) synthesis GTPase MnmE [Thiohalobacter sp. IOR34]
MNRRPDDTIAAIATPPGRGGVGILRISGPAAGAIAEGVLGRLPAPRRAELHDFRDAAGQTIDQGLALYFPAPHSFTGEEVLEFQGHGGPVVMDLLLARVLELGARLARPGEFSERAFLNDKLDLAQAEAVADLIDSGTAGAARAAMRSLQGEFSRRIHELVEGLIRLRMYVEAAIDFPEEEIDFLADGQVAAQLADLESAFDGVQAAARQGRLLREGMTLVIAGRPNAGKSSLLNALAGRDSAIVTGIPGTTRDLLREQVQIDGMPLHLIDTAGLRETEDEVEREGVRRAWQAIGEADRLLLVIDDQAGFSSEDQAILDRLPADLACTRVYNKIDLSGREAGPAGGGETPAIALSARTGAGLEALREHLKAVMGFGGEVEDGFIARRRHLDALARARAHLDAGRELLQGGAGELLAEELRLAQQALGEITGEVTADDLLGRIFASFCIGK